MTNLCRLGRWSIALACAACLAAPASASAGWSVYVANFGDDPVAQLCTTATGLTEMVPATVPAAGSGGIGNLNADGLAVGRDGRSVYVANHSEDNIVVQLDAATDGRLMPKTPAKIATPLDNPIAIAVSPDGNSAYVVDQGVHNATDTIPSPGVSEYDVGTGGVLTTKARATVGSGNQPDAIAISPDGRHVYVANGGDNTVSQYTVGSGGELSPMTRPTVAAGTNPTGIAVSPDGKSVYVTDANDNTVSQYDVGAGGGLVPKPTAAVGAGSSPSAIAISPDGRSAYVTNAGFGGISQYDIGPGGELTAKAPAVVGAGAGPDAIAVSPDSMDVFVANGGDGTVTEYQVLAGGKLRAHSTVQPQHPASGPDAIAIGAQVPCVFFKDAITHIIFLNNQTASISNHLTIRAAIGILVERIQRGRHVPVGRVLFGQKRAGHVEIRWNLKVGGQKVPSGRYLITLRALDNHRHVLARAKPVVITIR